MSIRRVKKGPGRRPQSDKRERFMGLRAKGWSVSAASREAGVSRTTGANWSRGYKTYRRGVAVGFVAALDRLEVKQVSTRYLSLDERVRIADLRQRSMSIRQIAFAPGRSPRRSPGSCGVRSPHLPAVPPGTGRSKHTVTPSGDERVIAAAEPTRTPCCMRSLRSC